MCIREINSSVLSLQSNGLKACFSHAVKRRAPLGRETRSIKRFMEMETKLLKVTGDELSSLSFSHKPSTINTAESETV